MHTYESSRFRNEVALPRRFENQPRTVFCAAFLEDADSEEGLRACEEDCRMKNRLTTGAISCARFLMMPWAQRPGIQAPIHVMAAGAGNIGLKTLIYITDHKRDCRGRHAADGLFQD